MNTTNKLTLASFVPSVFAALMIVLSIVGPIYLNGYGPESRIEPWIIALGLACVIVISLFDFSIARSIRKGLGAEPEDIGKLAEHLAAGRLAIATLTDVDCPSGSAAASLVALAERLSVTLGSIRDSVAQVEKACGRIDLEAYQIGRCGADPEKGVQRIEAEAHKLSLAAIAIREQIDPYSFLDKVAQAATMLSAASRQIEVRNLAELKPLASSSPKRPRTFKRRRRSARTHRA